MVDLQTIPSNIGLVVRFLRKTWSPRLQRSYMTTDLIIVVPTEHEADLRADFDIYRKLDEPAQHQVIEQLRTLRRYTGQVLTPANPPKARRKPKTRSQGGPH